MAALAQMRDPVQVVGTNDLLNTDVLQGTHATHYLIDRRYIDQAGGVPGAPPGIVLFEGYGHNFTDTEFIAVARARGVFAPCLASVVEHVHFFAGKAEPRGTRHMPRGARGTRRTGRPSGPGSGCGCGSDRGWEPAVCLEGIDPCEAAVARTAEVYHLAADMGGMGFIASQRALLKSALRA